MATELNIKNTPLVGKEVAQLIMIQFLTIFSFSQG